MADNFKVTAERMYASAKTLYESNDHHNSCYLGGYVIECYQKILYLLLAPGAPQHIHDLGELKQSYKDKVYVFRNSSQLAKLKKLKVNVDIELAFNRIYNSWNPIFRYDDSQDRWNEEVSKEYQKELKHCKYLINQLQINGLI